MTSVSTAGSHYKWSKMGSFALLFCPLVLHTSHGPMGTTKRSCLLSHLSKQWQWAERLPILEGTLSPPYFFQYCQQLWQSLHCMWEGPHAYHWVDAVTGKYNSNVRKTNAKFIYCYTYGPNWATRNICRNRIDKLAFLYLIFSEWALFPPSDQNVQTKLSKNKTS